MSFVKTGFSAIGKLIAVGFLAAAFLASAIGVLILALRSPEVKVPSIVGKEKPEGEKELASLGLKIRQRATRYSQEKPNTILEQTPIEGESVKTGQTISVVVARAEAEGDEKPAEVKKESVDDDKNKEKKQLNATPTPKRKVANANIGTNKNTAKNANRASGNLSNTSISNANTGGNDNKSNDNSTKTNPDNPVKPNPTPKTTPKPAENKPTPKPASSPNTGGANRRPNK